MTLEILPRAKEDLVAGFYFYEHQEQGLGKYFRDSLFADVELLRVTAGVHARVLGYHRSVSNNFPFAIYYRVTGTLVQVHAVLDCRKNPLWIKRRLSAG